MTLMQQIITIGLCALGTMLTRFLPFLIFNENKKTPAFVQYLGRGPPGAIFAIMRIIEWKTLLLPTWTDFGVACSVDRMIAKIGAQSLYCALLFGLVLCCPLKMTV